MIFLNVVWDKGGVFLWSASVRNSCKHTHPHTRMHACGHTHMHTHTHPHAHTQREALVSLLVVWLGGSCRIMQLAVVMSLKPLHFHNNLCPSSLIYFNSIHIQPQSDLWCKARHNTVQKFQTVSCKQMEQTSTEDATVAHPGCDGGQW